ncbi:hypothetical protein ACQ4M4_25470 [Leptolyngbya sp. AN02str]|uniref:hypothetical protein n=1 Tax=Leptolyngbya sp. AN02str TaxID=3423363 RepID=UPI003D31C397
MSNHPYLPHLISDPTYGYLFPHRLTLAAFGVPNDYHLRKHYPRLVEGQHYLKIRGSDHVERIFYTLIGLLTLADLVNTPEAKTFQQALIAHTQPGGALVPVHPAPLSPPPAHATTLDWVTPAAFPIHAPIPQSTPARWVAQSLPPEIDRAIQPAPASPPISLPTPQDTAALIFEAQRVAAQHAQQTAQTLLNAQRLIHDHPPSNLHLHLNIFKRWDTWLAQQDTWAMTLVATAIFVLAGTSAYLLVGALLPPAPPPHPSTYLTEIAP